MTNEKPNKNEVKGKEALKALMEEIIDISLWSNATDLLLLLHAPLEELQSWQGKKSREFSKENMVDDDMERPEIFCQVCSTTTQQPAKSMPSWTTPDSNS